MAAVAVIAAVLLSNARAEARPSDDAPFRFSFSHTELHSPATARALDVRLRSEVASFCRREAGGPILRWGCQRSLIQAARQELRARSGA